jgi:hypothetical protein
MSKWLKALLFGIWGLLLIPPIGTTLEKWLGENVLSEPNGVATTISNNLAAVSQLRWFKFALVFMTGLVIGASLESLNQKSGERKAFEVRSLGYKFRSLSDSIKTRIESSGWPDSVRDLRPAIMSAFISAQKFDLWVPSERGREQSRHGSSGRSAHPAALRLVSQSDDPVDLSGRLIQERRHRDRSTSSCDAALACQEKCC